MLKLCGNVVYDVTEIVIPVSMKRELESFEQQLLVVTSDNYTISNKNFITTKWGLCDLLSFDLSPKNEDIRSDGKYVITPYNYEMTSEDGPGCEYVKVLLQHRAPTTLGIINSAKGYRSKDLDLTKLLGGLNCWKFNMQQISNLLRGSNKKVIEDYLKAMYYDYCNYLQFLETFEPEFRSISQPIVLEGCNPSTVDSRAIITVRGQHIRGVDIRDAYNNSSFIEGSQKHADKMRSLGILQK
jgi:hypothetical protein